MNLAVLVVFILANVTFQTRLNLNKKFLDRNVKNILMIIKSLGDKQMKFLNQKTPKC